MSVPVKVTIRLIIIWWRELLINPRRYVCGRVFQLDWRCWGRREMHRL